MSIDVLPLYVVPKKGELFSSWLFRLSYSHRCKTYTFYRYYFDVLTNWTKDIDRSVSESFLNKLSKRTPYSSNELAELTLQFYNSKLFLQDNSSGINKWILSTGIRGRRCNNAYLNYCSNCFAEGYSFYHKEWRLILFSTCYRCGNLLNSHCTTCGAIINFFRNDIGIKTYFFNSDICTCSQCGSDLSKTSSTLGSDELIKMENRFRDFIFSGVHPIFQYSFIYFDVLYQVITCLMKFNKMPTRLRLYDVELGMRRNIILKAYLLLDDFPMELINFAKANTLSASFWLKDFSPDWFRFRDEVVLHLSKLRLTQFG